MLVAAAIAFALPRSSALELRSARGDWRRLLAHPPYVRLLGMAFLGYVTLQGPMGMFPIFVRAHGGSLDTVSHLWVLMLSLELPLIAFLGREPPESGRARAARDRPRRGRRALARVRIRAGVGLDGAGAGAARRSWWRDS